MLQWMLISISTSSKSRSNYHKPKAEGVGQRTSQCSSNSSKGTSKTAWLTQFRTWILEALPKRHIVLNRHHPDMPKVCSESLTMFNHIRELQMIGFYIHKRFFPGFKCFSTHYKSRYWIIHITRCHTVKPARLTAPIDITDRNGLLRPVMPASQAGRNDPKTIHPRDTQSQARKGELHSMPSHPS